MQDDIFVTALDRLIQSHLWKYQAAQTRHGRDNNLCMADSYTKELAELTGFWKDDRRSTEAQQVIHTYPLTT